MSEKSDFTHSDFTAVLLTWLVFTVPFTTPLLLGSVDTTTGTPSAQQRSLVAFTLELAATGGAPARTRMLLGVGQ